MMQVVSQDVARHATRILEELHRMKGDHDHCDFIIQVGDDVYRTHKNVLSAGSAYFRAMLKYETKESRDRKVVLKDVDSQCVKNCIDFIYSGKFEIPDGSIIELLHVAMMMQLDDVKQAVTVILKKSITIENYFSTRNVGDIYGLVDVSSRCRIFLQENIMEISDQAGFESIEKDDLLSLLKSGKVKLWEEEKLALSLKWIKKCQSKSKYLHEFLKVIKFYLISPPYLQHILETEPRLSNDFELYKLFNDHIMKASVKAKEDNDADKMIILFDDVAECLRSFNPITEEIEKFHDAELHFSLHFTAISHDSYIYVFSEAKSFHRLNFQKKNSKWEKMDDMICDHGMSPSSVYLTGSIIVIGGSGYAEKADVEGFDPSVNQWFLLRNKPSAISNATLVSLDGSVYCIGGWQDGAEVSSFCRFTPSSSDWVDLEPMRYHADSCGVVAVDQKIFVTGGYSEEDTVNNVECYDVTSAQWTSLPPMNSCHGNNTAYRIGNWIYVVDAFGGPDVIEKYDLLNKKWYKMKEADKPLYICGSVMVKEYG